MKSVYTTRCTTKQKSKAQICPYMYSSIRSRSSQEIYNGKTLLSEKIHKDLEWNIRLQASKMLSSFYHDDIDASSNRKWKAGYNEHLRRLKLKCKEYDIFPLPIELIELEGYLSGKKKNVIQVEKMFVASSIAEEFGQNDIDKYLPAMIDIGTEALDELNGIRNTEIKKSKDHDRRKTVRRWLADPDFLAELDKKRKRVLKNLDRHGSTNLQIVKNLSQQE